MTPAASPSRLLPRQRLCLAIHAVAAIALVPGFLWVAPPSRWDDPELLVVLGMLAVVASRSEVRLPSGVGFDGAIALMLLAVALAGPLPAMEIIVLEMLTHAATGRRRLLRAGNLAGLASYGWQAITAALLLHVGGVQDPTSPAALGWLLGAGAVLYTVGWSLGPAVYGRLWLGRPYRVLVRGYFGMLPAGGVLVLLAAATVLAGPMGLLAVTVLAFIAILPQSFIKYAATSEPVARLDQATATRRYAHALAVQLGMARRERRHLARVVAAARRQPPTGHAIDYLRSTLKDPTVANFDAQLASEWWNGRGGPVGLRADAIPLTARVLAVAQTWSALTARGTPELSYDHALEQLGGAAGMRLDPDVVDAAKAVVSQERVTGADPAPEPRLHRLHVPASVRRALTVG